MPPVGEHRTLADVRGDAQIRYARVNDADVAYQVDGEGPDLLFIPGLVNHIESAATVPAVTRHYDRLGHFARVVLYDKRGTGFSGPLSANGTPTMEDRVDEALAVLDAVGSDRAAVYATADGGPVGIMLAAMQPRRVQRLAVYGSSARLLAAADYPVGLPPELLSPAVTEEVFLTWGDDDDPTVANILPTQANNRETRRAVAGMERHAGSPRAAQRFWQVVIDTDVRDVLPTVRVPTLVMHVRGDRVFPI